MPATQAPRREELDKETIDNVLRLLSRRCRNEVELALDDHAELSITCKQEIQSALSGYDGQESRDSPPELPPQSVLVRHQSLIAGGALAVGVLVIVLRLFSRRCDGAARNKAKSKPKKQTSKKEKKK